MVASKDQGIDELMRFAIEAVTRAGESALSYYGKGRPGMRFDEGLITEAELHLNQLFQDQLRERFPHHQTYKNTQEISDYTHEAERYLWVYDALDGVANFQAGIPVWGTSLALLDNSWPILGVFHMPVTGDLFCARAGQKAYRGEKEIQISVQDDINEESLLLSYSRFHNHYRSTFPGKIRDLGCTSAHICYVAGGCAEAAIIANETYEGLTAARVIIEAAGGVICRMDGSEFFLNHYLNGDRIDETLMVVSPETYHGIRDYLQAND